MEELGIEVRIGKPLMSVEHEYDSKTITLHVFHCAGLMGQPKGLEGQETKWIYPEDLPKYSFPPPDRTIIESIIGKARPETSLEHP